MSISGPGVVEARAPAGRKSVRARSSAAVAGSTGPNPRPVRSSMVRYSIKFLLPALAASLVLSACGSSSSSSTSGSASSAPASSATSTTTASSGNTVKTGDGLLGRRHGSGRLAGHDAVQADRRGRREVHLHEHRLPGGLAPADGDSRQQAQRECRLARRRQTLERHDAGHLQGRAAVYVRSRFGSRPGDRRGPQGRRDVAGDQDGRLEQRQRTGLEHARRRRVAADTPTESLNIAWARS